MRTNDENIIKHEKIYPKILDEEQQRQLLLLKSY
jgi:hypothetical protein